MVPEETGEKRHKTMSSRITNENNDAPQPINSNNVQTINTTYARENNNTYVQNNNNNAKLLIDDEKGPYGKLVAGSMVHSIRKSNTSIGIVSNGHPSWAWYVGCLGEIRWLCSKKDLCARLPSDPPWHCWPGKADMLEPVEIVLVQGPWPKKTSAIWKMKGLLHVFRIGPCQRERAGFRWPDGWIASQTELHHAVLGGVTNASYRLWSVSRGLTTTVVYEPPQGLPTTLNQVLIPQTELDSVERFKWVKRPAMHQLNTGMGILNWSDRFESVIAPSVFRLPSWLQRKMTTHELASALDFPTTRIDVMTTQELEGLTKTELPGKIFVAALEQLRVTSERTYSKAESDRKRRLGIAAFAAQPMGKRRRGLIEDNAAQTGSPENEVPTFETVDEQYDEEDVEASLETSRETMWALHENMRASETQEEMGDTQGFSTVTDKAVKADDAAIPLHLWNDRIAKGLQEMRSANNETFPYDFTEVNDRLRFQEGLDGFRKLGLFVWKRNVRRSFWKWFNKFGIHRAEREAMRRDGMKACAKADQCSWWNWDKGSAIFFWRWPPDYQETARIGVMPYFDKEPPRNQDRQPDYQDETVREMVKAKLQIVIDKGYIEIVDLEAVEAMMYMFHVPKGSDIRMVYDGSKSGLNDALWAPWFALPTIDSMARWVVAGSWLADNDYGEQFLNFPLHPDLQKYCGVDLSQLFPDRESQLIIGRWTRNAMGLRPSPYNSVQGALRAKHFIMGDPKEANNPFAWERIVLNLPGSKEYDPRLPWVMKVRKDGNLASGVAQYIDDLRTMASTKDLVWESSSRLAKGLSYLGLQDAARKRRDGSQKPGAWAGSVIVTLQGVFKGVTQERWEKTQQRIRCIGKALGLRDEYTNDEEIDELMAKMDARGGDVPEGDVGQFLHFKALESATGFLIYVAMTYPSLKPYLKGLYLTLNSWRPNRDHHGWKKRKRDVEQTGDHGPPPKYVRVATRGPLDVGALMELTAFKEPPLVPIRPVGEKATFMVGDASGMGFGSSTWTQGTDVVEAEHGNWSLQVTRDSSSNFREAANLAMRLKFMVSEGILKRGSEIWVFTDNTTAEKTYHKGSSSSPLLHQMVLELRKLEMEGALKIHYVWFSGKRMIWQGTDGLSRGDLTSGVMAGDKFLKYIPLNETALEREEKLEETVMKWLPGEWRVASKEDWFYGAFNAPKVGWIWAPPPALARTVLEQLCEMKHMFPQSKHVFICPSLMTGGWRKTLQKLADVTLNFAAGNIVWGRAQFEPLTIALVCPLLDRSPWKVGRTEYAEKWEAKVSGLLWNDQRLLRGHMRKFWLAKPPRKIV